MSKLKYAPTPPPEIDEILEPGPKKRGRKRTKKQYFTPDTDAAIKEYLSTSNQDERDTTELYVKHNTAGKTFADFERDMDRDTFMSASESADYGLVDKIIHKRP